MATTAPRGNGRARAARVADVEALHPPCLADALLACAAEAPKLRRDAVGQIQHRTYPYTTLDSLLDDVAPLLLKHQLVWTAKVTLQDGQPAALYKMEHLPSGESEEWTGPLPCVDPGPQALGSAITYMRRYTLVAYLNLAPGEDDDGASASPLRPVDRYAEAEAESGSTVPAAAQPTAEPAKPTERRANVKQRNMLESKQRAAKLSDGDFANAILAAAGDPPRAWSDENHAEQTLKRLLDHLPARLVTTVKEAIG